MKSTTTPASRFGWQGNTVEYVVKAEGASEVLAPRKSEEGLKVRIIETRQTADGVEARVAVDVVGPALY